MRKALIGLYLALGISALFIPGVQAQITGASTGVRTVVADLIEWTGTQKFRDNVEVGGTLTVVGAQTNTGAITGDDLVAVDDLTVGDDVVVTGTTTFTTGISNGSTLSTSANGTRFYSGTTTLTEAGGAETIFTVTNATTQATSGELKFHFRGTDGTDHQSTVGTLIFTMVNKAGTVTSTFLPATIAAGITQESATQALSSGTMTAAFDSVEASNSTVISINIDSSLTLTGASLEWVLILHGPGTIS